MNKNSLVFLSVVAAVAIIYYSGSCHAADISVDSLKNQFLPKEFRNKNFTLDDMKQVFYEKCKKATGVHNSTLYTDIEKGIVVLKDCLYDLANFTAIQEEIEEARPLGELDTVFHKYCSKVPEVEQCLKSFNSKIIPCLTAEERNQNAIMMRIANSLMGFMCAKGGDQIALFVAEDGPECLEANKEAIAHCANSSFAEFIPKDGSMPDIFNLPELVLKPEHCVDFARFESCTLHHLEQCQEITPANVAESVFRFVKNETDCNNWMANKANERSVLRKTNSGVNVQISLLAFFGSALIVYLHTKLS